MKHVALLRAVNLAGRNAVSMAALREVARALGLGEPVTLRQSGNLIFDARSRSPAALERRLAEETKTRLGLDTDFFVRTAAEWDRIVAACPFPREARSDPQRLLLVVLADPVAPERLEALQAAIRGRERVAAAGRQLYAVYPDGVGRSKLTTALIQKHLATRCTARNWNTVLELQARLRG